MNRQPWADLVGAPASKRRPVHLVMGPRDAEGKRRVLSDVDGLGKVRAIVARRLGIRPLQIPQHDGTEHWTYPDVPELTLPRLQRSEAFHAIGADAAVQTRSFRLVWKG